MGEIAEQLIYDEMFRNGNHSSNYHLKQRKSGIRKYLTRLGLNKQTQIDLLREFTGMNQHATKETMYMFASERFGEFREFIKKKKGGTQ
jgi:hypothetical protein